MNKYFSEIMKYYSQKSHLCIERCKVIIMKKTLYEDKEFKEALYHDGQKNIDDFVPDQVSAEEARRMMLASMKDAKTVLAQKKQGRYLQKKIISVAVAVIIVLFIVTPVGRALALEAVKAIVEIFSGEIFIRDVKKAKAVGLQKVLPHGEYQFSSVGELAKTLGQPVVGIQNDDVVSADVTLSSEEGLDSIITLYGLKSGDSLITIQIIWPDGHMGSTTINKPDDYELITAKLYNGADMYIIQNEDGVGGTALWENIELSISSETLTIPELIQYINQLKDIN